MVHHYKNKIFFIVVVLIINICIINYSDLNHRFKEACISTNQIYNSYFADSKINKETNSFILNQNEKDKLIVLVGLSSLRLLYRASFNGFEAASFHSNVDHKSNTIVIVKPKNLDCVFGGLASVAWDSASGYKSDEKAYLFSIRRVGSETSCINQVMIQDTNKAIYCNQSYDPYFGNGDMIIIFNNTQSITLNEMTANSFYNCCPEYNQALDTAIYNKEKINSFQIQEIEVFQYS